MTITIDTETDHDAAIAEKGVHDEQPANTDWAASDIVEKGYPGSDWGVWSGIPTPIAYYPLNENSGTTANDVTGNANDGTYDGVTLGNANGILNNDYASFDGTDDKVNLPVGIADTINTANAITIAAWVYPVQSTNDGTICANHDDNSLTDKKQWLLWQDVGGSNGFAWRILTSANDKTKIGTENSDATLNTWQFVTATYDGSTDAMATYVDGGPPNATGTRSGTINDTTRAPAIAANSANNGGKWFDGRIQDVLIWNEALSQSEVTELYEAAL